MKELTCFIVEDQPDQRDYLIELIQQYFPQIGICGFASHVEDAAAKINSLKPNLLVCDVEIEGGTSFDVLERLTYFDYQLIFNTGYDKYAIKAFRFSAFDYLLKPLLAEDFVSSMNRLLRKRTNQSEEQIKNLLNNLKVKDESQKRIPLPSQDRLNFVPVNEILRLEAKGNYTQIEFKNGKNYLVSKTLKEYETMLNDYHFLRVHQSHLVNSNYIQSFVKKDGGYLVMDDGSCVAISRNRKSKVLQELTSMHH